MLIDDTLVDLDFKGLYRLAEWHEKQAVILRSRAHRLEQREDEGRHIDRRLRFLAQLHRAVQTYLRHGYSLGDACGMVARDCDVPFATVENYWARFISGKTEKDKGERNQLMLDLAALGLTNQQIGDRVGLHPVSVSRILSKERRTRLWTPDRQSHPGLYEITAVRRKKTAERGPAVLTLIQK